MKSTRLIALALTFIVTLPFSSPALGASMGRTVRIYADFLSTSASSSCSLSVPTYEPAKTTYQGDLRPPLGQHAVGWSMPTVGQNVGPTFIVYSPADLTELGISVLSTAADDYGLAQFGISSATEPGYWSGLSTFGGGSPDIWNSYELADNPFSWTHFNADGVADGYVASDTIRHVASTVSGDPLGGVVLGYGCAGGSFYVDDVRIGQFGVTDHYDLEGYKSLSTIAQTHYAVNYGESATIIGDAWDNTGDPIVGTLELFGRATGKHAFVKLGNARATVHQHARMRVRPRVTTTYKVKFPGDQRFNSSSSSTVVVQVLKVVSASIPRASIRRGQSLTVRGSVSPHKRGLSVQLQRWNSHRWVSWARGRTGNRGGYSFTVRPPSSGIGLVRVVAGAGKGTGRGSSEVKRFTVTSPAPPPPPPSEPPPPPPPIIPPPPPIKT